MIDDVAIAVVDVVDITVVDIIILVFGVINGVTLSYLLYVSIIHSCIW